MNNPLPYRFREQSFRRYEQVIRQITESFPVPLVIDPAAHNLSPVTFSCRLRDAIKSHSRYRWAVRWEDEKFHRIANDIVVSERDGKLHVGSRETLKGSVQAFVPPSAPASTVALAVTSDLEKKLLVFLAVARALAGTLRVSGFTEADVAHYEANYDCSFVTNPDGTHTLL
jgi:hypothetical protein